ncbi:beta-1,6-N-acetylglucosaminyltransferase [Novosphingobium sp. ZW T3_23]|uniref:beta-1,6-N-acetylglucosaminyltransferase n=1 Tax=Novosphingobium sp. ZW T3_23 TaxID=3378084 RepID=UPI003851B2EB
MRMAYLLLAHDAPEQLERLVETLLAESTEDFAVIHADRRSALWHALRRRLPGSCGRVHLVPDPMAVRWGHWSQVAATGKLVREAVRLGCDHAHLLSGADWPVASRTELARALGKGLCHIEVRPGHMAERMQTYRFDTRWLRLDPARDKLAYAAIWELRRLARWLDRARHRFRRERRQPFGAWAYGSQWWSLPADALALLARELPPLLRSGRLKGTLCCDEHVVPTLIARHFPDRIAGNRRFVQFPGGASSPRLLDAHDLPEIAASDAWFMRKVSLTHDPFFLALPERQAGPDRDEPETETLV